MPRLSRWDVIEATLCPECGARRGEGCTRLRGEPRKSNHQARVNQAQNLAVLQSAENAEEALERVRDDRRSQ